MELLSGGWLARLVTALVSLVEAAGVLIIFAGAVVAFVRFLVVALRQRRSRGFTPVRLSLSRFLALGLEFQLASDILRTAVSPSLAEIGRLAAVAAIRTALNFILEQESRQEQRELAECGSGGETADRR